LWVIPYGLELFHYHLSLCNLGEADEVYDRKPTSTKLPTPAILIIAYTLISTYNMAQAIVLDQYIAARAYFMCVVGLLFIESAIRWPLYFLELRSHGKIYILYCNSYTLSSAS
jgi:hypothetical protein